PRAPAGVGLGIARRARAGRAHREQLGADVDAAEELRLALLQCRAMAHHEVELLAREAARLALDPAHVPGQRAEATVTRPAAVADPARRIPSGVEDPGAGEARQSSARRDAGHHRVRGDSEV